MERLYFLRKYLRCGGHGTDGWNQRTAGPRNKNTSTRCDQCKRNQPSHRAVVSSLFRAPAPQPNSPAAIYNRYVIRSPLIAALAGIVLLAGCKKDIQNKDAVRQGVMSYLSKRSDLLAMDVTVDSVAFHDDEATAEVHFQAKGNTSPAAGMSMQYVLERKDGQWVVKGRTGANAAHGESAAPSGAAAGQGSGPGPLDGMPHSGLPSGGGAGALPPGHPAIGGSQALPPGHPSIPDSNGQK